jgi:hypothetical protein
MNRDRQTVSGTRVGVWLACLAAVDLSTGCSSGPMITKTVYEDRSAWIRLEINPDTESGRPAGPTEATPPVSSGTISGLLKGLQAEKDYNPGLISMATGKKSYNPAFVEAELMVLAPQLAKALTMAAPNERAAYCLTADIVADERFVTTGWAYIKKPHLHFRIEEWRTPVRVKSPAVPTSEACKVKPLPGYKTSDRMFQVDYNPKALIVTHGPMGRSLYNGRGEIMFKLDALAAAVPAADQGGGTPMPAAGIPPAQAGREKPAGAR